MVVGTWFFGIIHEKSPRRGLVATRDEKRKKEQICEEQIPSMAMKFETMKTEASEDGGKTISDRGPRLIF